MAFSLSSVGWFVGSNDFSSQPESYGRVTNCGIGWTRFKRRNDSAFPDLISIPESIYLSLIAFSFHSGIQWNGETGKDAAKGVLKFLLGLCCRLLFCSNTAMEIRWHYCESIIHNALRSTRVRSFSSVGMSFAKISMESEQQWKTLS